MENLFDQLAALLSSSNDESPLNPIAAELFRENREAYYDHSKFFTSLFAKPNSKNSENFTLDLER